MVPGYVETILRSILVNLALLWPFGKRKMNFLSWKNTHLYRFFGVWVNFLTLSLCHTPTNYIFLESTEKILLESIIKSWISLNHSATEFCHPICHESWLIPWNPTYVEGMRLLVTFKYTFFQFKFKWVVWLSFDFVVNFFPNI